MCCHREDVTGGSMATFQVLICFLILKVPSNVRSRDIGTGGDSGKVSHD